jgi:hypothetical protein
MGDYRIDCTTKDGPDPNYSIDGFGGLNPDGTRWYVTLARILELMDAGHTFWVSVQGRRVEAYPVTRGNSRYVTTTADSFPPNNLLHLTDCR